MIGEVLKGLKHGPGGKGGPGPCDSDCEKCEQEFELAKKSPLGAELRRALDAIDTLIRREPQRFVDHMAEHAGQFELLAGPELHAYRAFKTACERAQATAVEAGLAKQELHRAIESLGRTIAPPSKTE
jgi:hypothetical protein